MGWCVEKTGRGVRYTGWAVSIQGWGVSIRDGVLVNGIGCYFPWNGDVSIRDGVLLVNGIEC